ncbi:MAG: 2Fe-2S iron-sulfur cluster-binding protein, partial [Prochloraceae cyanobacterium]
MSVKTLTINNIPVAVEEGATILEAAKEAGVHIPTLCFLEGVSSVAACRMCLVEIEGINKLLPSCVTQVTEEMVVHTDTPKLQEYRRMVMELLFAEGNHVCSICVAYGNCVLQNLAIAVGIEHSRFAYR